MIDGKAVRFSFDVLSPFMVFDRAPWYQDGAWLTAAARTRASAALAAHGALVAGHRHRASPLRREALALDPRALRAFRLSKIAAILILAALGIVGDRPLPRMFNDLNKLGAKFDSMIHFAQLFGMLAFIGGFAADAVEFADGVDRQAPLARQDLEHRARACSLHRAVDGLRVQFDRLRGELLMRALTLQHRGRETAPGRAVSHLRLRIRGARRRRRNARRRHP